MSSAQLLHRSLPLPLWVSAKSTFVRVCSEWWREEARGVETEVFIDTLHLVRATQSLVGVFVYAEKGSEGWEIGNLLKKVVVFFHPPSRALTVLVLLLLEFVVLCVVFFFFCMDR